FGFGRWTHRPVLRTPWQRSRRTQSGAETSASAPRDPVADSSIRPIRAYPFLAQRPSGQVNEHGLQAGSPYVDVIDRATGGPDPFEEGRQLGRNIPHPRLHDSLVSIRTVLRARGVQKRGSVARGVR